MLKIVATLRKLKIEVEIAIGHDGLDFPIDYLKYMKKVGPNEVQLSDLKKKTKKKRLD